MRHEALTSSLEGNLAGLTGSQNEDTLNPRAGGKLGVWSEVTVDQDRDMDLISVPKGVF